MYRYTQHTNTDINKALNINEYVHKTDTKEEIKHSTIFDIYEKKFKLNSFIKEQLKVYENEIDIELFEYLLDQISSRGDIIAKDKYLLKTLNDLKQHNVKTIAGFINHTSKHKKELQRQKLAEKWGYTPKSDEYDTDFDKLAEMTRYR